MDKKSDTEKKPKIKVNKPREKEGRVGQIANDNKRRTSSSPSPPTKTAEPLSINLCWFLSPAVRDKCAQQAKGVVFSTEEKGRVEAMRQYFDQYWLSLVYYYKQRRARKQTAEKYLQAHPEWEIQKRDDFRRDQQNKESQLLRCRRARMAVQDFMLLAILGRGGFGEVYLCRKRDTGEVLALKKLVKKYFLQKNDVGKLKRERDVMVKNDSPWLIKLKYSFQSENFVYLAMEFIPGGDMKNLLDHVGGFEEQHARFYFAEMLLAVEALHGLGYIHRDLKPDNFLVHRNGHLKLIDFGLSKGGHLIKYEGTLSMRSKSSIGGHGATSPRPKNLTSPDSRTHRHRSGRKVYSIVGSPEYMAIEILEEVGYNHTVDYWSLGVIFYELYYGITPFNSETSEGALQKLSSYRDYIIPPPDLKDDPDIVVSPESWDLIYRLLTEPSKRIGRVSVQEIKQHPFFAGFNWNNIMNEEPPFVPSLSHEMDTAYFTDALDEDDYSALTINVNDLQEMIEAQGNSEHNIPIHLINVTTKEEASLGQNAAYFKNEYEQAAFAGWTFKHDHVQAILTRIDNNDEEDGSDQ